MAKSKLLNH